MFVHSPIAVSEIKSYVVAVVYLSCAYERTVSVDKRTKRLNDRNTPWKASEDLAEQIFFVFSTLNPTIKFSEDRHKE